MPERKYFLFSRGITAGTRRSVGGHDHLRER
jgi:hypothetical protein